MTSRQKYYRAFGLIYRSEISLPFQSVEAVEQVDVTVSLAKVCNSLPVPKIQHGLWQTREGTFLIVDDQIGKVLVENGCKITVELSNNSSLDHLLVFITGAANGALLQQRGLLPLHASSISTPHGAVLFSGTSGAGKSTLMAEFTKRGYLPIADDVSAISFDESGAPFVHPANTKLRLWQDSIEKLDFHNRERKAITNKINKFALQMPTFEADAKPLRAIYVLNEHNQPNIEFSLVEKLDRFNAISKCSFRKKFYKGMGLQQKHFQNVLKLTGNVPVNWLYRPTDKFLLKELADLVESDFLKEHSLDLSCN